MKSANVASAVFSVRFHLISHTSVHIFKHILYTYGKNTINCLKPNTFFVKLAKLARLQLFQTSFFEYLTTRSKEKLDEKEKFCKKSIISF